MARPAQLGRGRARSGEARPNSYEGVRDGVDEVGVSGTRSRRGRWRRIEASRLVPKLLGEPPSEGVSWVGCSRRNVSALTHGAALVDDRWGVHGEPLIPDGLVELC